MSTSTEEKKQNKSEPRPIRRIPGLPLGFQKQLECALPDDLAVVLSPKAFGQLFGYASATELEVSLLGIVERDRNRFKVREFFLVPQRGGASHTETDPAAIGELVERLVAEGRSGDAANIRCWAHSHPGMDVFWSKTDDDNCRRLCANWLVSIVVSDGFKVRSRVDVASPVPFTVDCVPTFLESPVEEDIAVECAHEVKEKIKSLPSPGFRHPGRGEKEKDNMDPKTERPAEILEYCDLCGGWHVEDDCPMQFESSAYELAHRECALAIEDDAWGEDMLWF